MASNCSSKRRGTCANCWPCWIRRPSRGLTFAACIGLGISPTWWNGELFDRHGNFLGRRDGAGSNRRVGVGRRVGRQFVGGGVTGFLVFRPYPRRTSMHFGKCFGVAFSLAFLGLMGGTAAAEKPAPESVAKLIDQLGAEDFNTRQQANEKL